MDFTSSLCNTFRNMTSPNVAMMNVTAGVKKKMQDARQEKGSKPGKTRQTAKRPDDLCERNGATQKGRRKEAQKPRTQNQNQNQKKTQIDVHSTAWGSKEKEKKRKKKKSPSPPSSSPRQKSPYTSSVPSARPAPSSCRGLVSQRGRSLKASSSSRTKKPRKKP